MWDHNDGLRHAAIVIVATAAETALPYGLRAMLRGWRMQLQQGRPRERARLRRVLQLAAVRRCGLSRVNYGRVRARRTTTIVRAMGAKAMVAGLKKEDGYSDDGPYETHSLGAIALVLEHLSSGSPPGRPCKDHSLVELPVDNAQRVPDAF